MQCYLMLWYGMVCMVCMYVWYGMVWYGMVWYVYVYTHYIPLDISCMYHNPWWTADLESRQKHMDSWSSKLGWILSLTQLFPANQGQGWHASERASWQLRNPRHSAITARGSFFGVPRYGWACPRSHSWFLHGGCSNWMTNSKHGHRVLCPR